MKKAVVFLPPQPTLSSVSPLISRKITNAVYVHVRNSVSDNDTEALGKEKIEEIILSNDTGQKNISPGDKSKVLGYSSALCKSLK